MAVVVWLVVVVVVMMVGMTMADVTAAVASKVSALPRAKAATEAEEVLVLFVAKEYLS